MEQLRPSPAWDILLVPFESLFTKSGYRYFRAFVIAFAHLHRRLWVTQVVLCSGVQRGYPSFCQFLDRGAWRVSNVRRKLFERCLSVCVDEEGRLLAAVDDTVCAKYGRHFEGLGVHHDPMNRQHPKKRSRGHCFVCLALLGETFKEHFVALFVGCALYVQQSVREAAQESAKKAGKAGKAFATKLELAVGLVLDLPIPPGVLVLGICDGAYAKKAFVQPICASGRHVLSRLRSDTVF